MGTMNENERHEAFKTPSPVRLKVEIPAGRVTVVAETTGETRITLIAVNGNSTARRWIAEAEITQSGDDIVVRIPKSVTRLWGSRAAVDAEIRVPLESAANIATGSGAIESFGRLGTVRANSGSGAIRLDDCADAEAHTGSGEIAVKGASGSVDAKTGSGHVTLGKIGADARIATGSGHAEVVAVGGEARIHSASGHIEVGQTGDSLNAYAMSGSIRIHRADHGRVTARTISGGVRVGVPNGTAALLDISTMSGRVNSDLQPGDAPGESERQVELILSTLSGNVTVARV
jgi:DUF4097 and DUF4098 domain-containing protein YvlB